MRIHDYPCPRCGGTHFTPEGALCDEKRCGGTGFFWPDEVVQEAKSLMEFDQYWTDRIKKNLRHMKNEGK